MGPLLAKKGDTEEHDGKASGKRERPFGHYCALGGSGSSHAAHDDRVYSLEKRIAELEAERDYEHATAGELADLADQYKARAEKAEAEVKSLLSQKPRENEPDWMAHIRSCPNPDCASESRARAHMAARKERD